MSAKLDGLTATAWDASSKASDSGTLAFTQHQGYAAALKDINAAINAWQAVLTCAQAEHDPASSDAIARMGELETARDRMVEDLRTNILNGNVKVNLTFDRVALQTPALAPNHYEWWQGFLKNAPATTSAQPASQAIANVRTSAESWWSGLSRPARFGVGAGAVLAATKLLGLW